MKKESYTIVWRDRTGLHAIEREADDFQEQFDQRRERKDVSFMQWEHRKADGGPIEQGKHRKF